MSRDLIVFGEDWGGLPSSTQHLVSHLAETRKVVWVNSIGLRRPRLSRRDIQRAWSKLWGKQTSKPQSQNLNKPESFHIVQPRTLPVPGNQLERGLAKRLLLSQIKPVVKAAQLESPILWTSLPTAVDLAGHLEESALVYYCGDDFGALAGVDHTTVMQREQELASKADLIMTVSEPLAKRFPHANTRLLPHGVDFDLFSTPAPRASDLPRDGRPVAGFYGSLSEWLDLDLLRQAIVCLPNWHFVFIGKAQVDLGEISAFPNVHLLGTRSHEQLPSYVQHWNASLLPFKDNAQIRACNPLKLREYLAAGRPVISTPFAALEPYRDFVQQVRNADQLVDALKLSICCDNLEKQKQSVAAHTWQAKAQQVSGWLEQL